MKTKFSLFLLMLAIFHLALAEEVLLDIMFTNDIHGGIDRYEATFINPNFPPMLGGGGSAATYINQVRVKGDGKNRDSFLFDVGDFFQGHPIGSMTDGEAIITYMNMIGYDISVIGNHEYDIPEERLIEVLADADFPILSCNIVKRGTDELVDYVIPYIMMERMGIKFGIIGVTTTDTEKMSFPEFIKNVDFTDEKEALKKYIPIVKEKGADIIIVAGHMGLPYEPLPAYERRYVKKREHQNEHYWGYDAQELVHEVEGIDLFFGGHMHKGFAEPWEDPLTHTLVFQGYAYGSNVGHVTIKIDKETKTISGYELPAIREGALITLFEDQIIPQADIADTILAMQKIAEEGMDEVIGEAAVYISRSSSGAQNLMGNLVCEAMLDYADADFSFLNLGGIRDELMQGPITYRDVFSVMPFDNQIIMFEVDGAFLKRIIETRVAGGRQGLLVAGVEVVFNRKRADFDRVTKLLIDGEPWQADKMYKIVTTDFLLQGNAGLALLTQIPEEQITRYERNLRDAIEDYIKENSPVKIALDKRWKQDDRSDLTEELKKELGKK
jgi:2',3'-cyclic-nucleotide 2'-phosphodiesterase (5'-nucleotidase family)